MKIKATSLHRFALLGLVAALLALPVNAAAAGIALAVTGFLAVLFADYGRNMEPLRVSADVIPFNPPRSPVSEMRDAA
jgi:hypothetical protein